MYMYVHAIGNAYGRLFHIILLRYRSFQPCILSNYMHGYTYTKCSAPTIAIHNYRALSAIYVQCHV